MGQLALAQSCKSTAKLLKVTGKKVILIAVTNQTEHSYFNTRWGSTGEWPALPSGNGLKRMESGEELLLLLLLRLLSLLLPINLQISSTFVIISL